MNSLLHSATKPGRHEREQAALVTLLADEDAAVYEAVREKILAEGGRALKWLRAHTLSDDPILRRRARDIVHLLERHEADNRFLAFCLSHGEELDIEKGSFLLAATRYPEINIDGYRALLDTYAFELGERIKPGTKPEPLMATINEYLFQELGFTGNEKDYYDPDNSYLNRVLDRRTGNPISLCILLLCLARRLKLPIAGIGMPGHFLCRHQSARGEVFIDPFNQGRLLTKVDCLKYLIQTGHTEFERFLSPMSPRRMLVRVCSNLHHTCTHRGMASEVERLHRYIVALTR